MQQIQQIQQIAIVSPCLILIHRTRRTCTGTGTRTSMVGLVLLSMMNGRSKATWWWRCCRGAHSVTTRVIGARRWTRLRRRCRRLCRMKSFAVRMSAMRFRRRRRRRRSMSLTPRRELRRRRRQHLFALRFFNLAFDQAASVAVGGQLFPRQLVINIDAFLVLEMLVFKFETLAHAHLPRLVAVEKDISATLILAVLVNPVLPLAKQ
mmetsp:Transcript_19562/g.31089  ORF Transcript_19562/g.31089 Transcript_19562/m.31089 type:complete len:207 (-) Transcript_19562:163-783(-)